MGKECWAQMVAAEPRFSNCQTCCYEYSAIYSDLDFYGKYSDKYVNVQWQQQQKAINTNQLDSNPLFSTVYPS